MFSRVSGTSTNMRVRSSLKRASPRRQTPRITWVSHEVAPKRSRKSRNTSAPKASGTGWPSLNRSGRKTSKRRNLVIRGGTLNGEADAFSCEEGKRLIGHNRVTVRPTLERKPTDEVPQAPPFSLVVGKPYDRHGPKLAFLEVLRNRQIRRGPAT